MFDFSLLDDEQKKEYAEIMFSPLNSAEELRNWVMLFLGLDMPHTHIDPESNSSPIEAMWEIYETVKNNKGDVLPGVILLSARAAYKTLGVSIIETILMLHFKITIAHMASIREQSYQSVQYINLFFTKIDPLLKVCGWQNKSQNKNQIEYTTKEGELVYIKIIVCTLSGSNSSHTNLLVTDEIDVINNIMAYEESKRIPTYSHGRYPITIKLSTRKFAFGQMTKEIENASITGEKVLRWNILDIAEKCTPNRYLPDEPKQDRYVAKSLPLQQISPEEYSLLVDAEKEKWDLVKNAYAGCTKCILLPICKKRLSERSDKDIGGLYRPINAIIGEFKTTAPDMAEAQLLCWRPSTFGLVYPRFDASVDKGNVLSIQKAYEILTGNIKKSISELTFLQALKDAQISFFAGADWGFTHETSIVIVAEIPNGEYWIIETFSASGLEFSDILEIAKNFRDKYNIQKWFVDTAMPAFMKSFNRNSMKCPKFTKDIAGGISSVRSKILTSDGRRLLKIIDNKSNKKIISAILKHRFQLDAQGQPTAMPDDEIGIADQNDALRYLGQNLWPVKGPQKPGSVLSDVKGPDDVNQNPTVNEQMKQEIVDRVIDGGGESVGGSGKKGGFHWSL